MGYVGLPVAVSFGSLSNVIGFDTHQKRIKELEAGYDRTTEVAPEKLTETKITFTSDSKQLRKADFHIVAVPTQINDAKLPEMKPLGPVNTNRP